MRDIVVAGGAGFVGQQVVRDLHDAGERVVVVDNCSRGTPDNLPPGVDIWKADVRTADLGPMLARAGAVFDFAARVYGVRDLYAQPGSLLADNVEMTIALLRAMVKAGVRRYVYISSSCVYDFPGVRVPHEEDDVGVCETSYGMGKLFGEHLARFYAREYGIDVRIVRLFNVYGPRDSFQSPHVIPDFVRKAWAIKAGKAVNFPIIGTGAQTRDFTWLGDAAAGILAVAAKGRPGQAYNIGTGREIEVKELARLVCQAMGLDPARVPFIQERAPREDIQRRAADVTRIGDDTGWKPTVALEDGIARVRDWLVPLLEKGAIAA